MCHSFIGQRDQKNISPTSFSREVFVSDTSPLSSPFSTGASIFVSSPSSSELKESPRWSTLSPTGLKPRSNRGSGSMEGSGEWAHKQIERLSPTTPEHFTFYKRTRPTKDYKELSSPKKTGETFSKAKEHSHSLKKTESKTQGAEQFKNRRTQTQAKAWSMSPGTSPQAGPALTLQRAEHQQGPPRRLKDFPSRESLNHEKSDCKRVNSEIRKSTQGMEERGERSRLACEQDNVNKRVVMVESQRHRPIPHTAKQSEKGAGRDSGQRDTAGKNKNMEKNRDISKVTMRKRERGSIKDTCSKTESVVSPKGVKGRDDLFSYCKEDRGKEDSVAISSIPGMPQSPKGPISPGPWKVPSSAKILSQAEVLRDPF